MLTPEQIAELQASAALMQQRIQAASDPNRNAAFDKYVADQAAKGVEVASTYTGGGGPLGSGGIFGITDFAPAFDPANPAGTTGQVVRFDPGQMNAPVVFQPGQQYVLTDASGENVVGRASSVEELQKLAAAKEKMPYGFQLYRADEQGGYQPGTQLFGETDPRTKGLMGAIVNYGLPIAVGAVTGGLGFLPAMAASGAASGAARLMTGYTPEDAAKAAAIAAATRGVLKGTGLEDALGQVLSAKGSAVGNAVNPGFYVPGTVIPKFVAPTLSGLGSTVGTLAAAPVAGEILVQGARNAVSPALASAITGAASSGFDQFLSDNAGMINGMTPEEPAAAEGPQNDYQPGDDAPIVVTGQSPLNIGGAFAPVAGAAAPTGGNLDYLNDILQDEINTQTVRGKRPITDKIITGVLGAAGLGAVANTVGASGKPATTGDKIQTGLTGAALLAGALGGGGGTGAGGATGLDALAPTFRAQLPTPRGQFTPQALTQRPPGEAGRPDIDYARYGYGPARSFFNYVPETQAERDAFAATAAAPAAPRVGVGTVMPQALPGAAQTGATDSVLRAGFEKLRAAVPGASDAELVAFLGTPEGQQELAMIFEGLGATTRAKGGSMGGKGQSRESFAVNGAGTGRSDEIPALLSDGEYVIDAETVALLGDGSGKAGAQRLDEFRAKIRKHKGRNLAKGKFSVNAKRPERYLSGGLV
jgi:hypothetical protein